MSHDLSLIFIRFQEVEQEIARLKDRLADMESERGELETAGRVVARLSGAGWPPAGSGNESKQEEASGAKPEGLPPVTEMILQIMEDEYRRTLGGVEPKNVARAIAEKWWPDVKGTYVSTTMWRMAQPKDGRLHKDNDSPVYTLPGKPYMPSPQINKSEKEVLANDFSDLLEPEAKGREAGPGGGT
jgi:hypothetical protein